MDLQAQGKIDNARAKRFLKMLDEQEAAYAKQYGTTTAAALASRDVVERLEKEAAEARRTKFLQIGQQRAILEGLTKHVAEGGRADQYAIALFDHHERVRGVSSLDNRRAAVRMLAWSKMGAFLRRFERDLLGRARNPADLENLVRSAFGETIDDAGARELAGAWGTTSEYLRRRFNAAGGHIGKLDRWGLPQAHDSLAVRGVPLDAWRAFIAPLLDRERTVDGITGKPFSDAELGDVLAEVYDTIVSDGLNKAKPGQMVGAKVANRRADSRFLHFRDADAWLAYAERFGTGDPWNAIVGHIDGMARDIASMEILGPNPGLTVRWLGDVLRQQVAPSRELAPNARAMMRAADAARETDRMWRMYSGELTRPHNGTTARVFSGIRNWNVTANLGGAFLSAITTDPTFLSITAAYNGLSATRGLMTYAKLLNPADRTHRRIALEAGLVVNDMTSRAERMWREGNAVPFNMHELSRRLADSTMRLSGLASHTEAMKQATGLNFMMGMAKRAGRSFDQLDEPFQRALTRYGIGAAGWDKARATPLFEQAGVRLLRPDEMADDRLATLFLEMIDSETRFATPGESLRAGTMLAMGGRGTFGERGTVPGELLHSMTQYKSYSIIAMMTQWQRIFFGDAPARSRSYYASGLVSLLTIGGLASLVFKAIADGKDPPPLDEKTMARAFIQGGGAGILGDFVNSGVQGQSRTGGGFAGYLAGPTIANVIDPAQRLAFGVPGAIGGDERSNLGREAERLFENNLPGSTLWYARLAARRLWLDRMREAADPQAHASWRRQQQRLRKDYGQAYFWRPGETAPDRAPDFDPLLGGNP
ncbi:hypothetical protein [Sphingomonas jatrophae]|uniref:hypothetical protein n=1 Tax=Sphingomonas jatrophae TaxID=1166337 RepID=UPI0010421A92|nr:hypothetical protein [Sphingomonas jatrophae]